jgi:hypothetical protein
VIAAVEILRYDSDTVDVTGSERNRIMKMVDMKPRVKKTRMINEFKSGWTLALWVLVCAVAGFVIPTVIGILAHWIK